MTKFMKYLLVSPQELVKEEKKFSLYVCTLVLYCTCTIQNKLKSLGL